MSDTLQAADSMSEREYLFPREHLEVFQKNGTEITGEGWTLPEKEFLKSFAGMFMEPVAGTLGAFAYLAAKKQHEKKEGTSKPFVSKEADMGMKTAFGWLLSPAMMISLQNLIQTTEIEVSVIRRIANRMTAMVSHSHPENHLTFLRNLMMTRKLQFLGKELSERNFSKPKIGYNVGMFHSGIEDLLSLPPEITLKILDAYPAEFWQEIVNVNGGVEAFCSNVLLTPDIRHSEKTVIQDTTLRQVIENKLSEVKKVPGR